MVNGRSCPAPPSAEPQAPEQLKQSLTPLPSCGPVGWGGGGALEAHWTKPGGPTKRATPFFGPVPVQAGT